MNATEPAVGQGRGVKDQVLRISVDERRCQGHGRCYELEPELFGPDINGHSRLLGVELDDAGALFAAERAIRNCPERALTFGVRDSARREAP